MRQLTPDQLRPGDLVACWGTDPLSRLISWGTASPLAPAGMRLSPSHVAIVCRSVRYGTARSGFAIWVESTSLCDHPCLIRGEKVSGCQAHLPEERVMDYCAAGGRVEVFRPTPIYSLDTREEELLSTILLKHFVGPGLAYDFGGAFLSSRRFRTLPRLLCADREKLFCSELCAAAIQRIGRLSLRNPSWYHPGRLTRELYQLGTFQRFAECRPDWDDGPAILPFIPAHIS